MQVKERAVSSWLVQVNDRSLLAFCGDNSSTAFLCHMCCMFRLQGSNWPLIYFVSALSDTRQLGQQYWVLWVLDVQKKKKQEGGWGERKSENSRIDTFRSISILFSVLDLIHRTELVSIMFVYVRVYLKDLPFLKKDLGGGVTGENKSRKGKLNYIWIKKASVILYTQFRKLFSPFRALNDPTARGGACTNLPRSNNKDAASSVHFSSFQSLDRLNRRGKIRDD